MSTDYELQGWFPFDEPAKATVEHVAAVLGAPVSVDVKGKPTFRSDSLLVYSFEPKRDYDRESARAALGFDINLTLVFADYSRGEDTRMMRAVQNMVRSVLSLAAVPGLRAVLIEEERRDDLVLMSLDNGQVTLNRAFEGWALWPEVLAVVPEPHHFDSLHIRDHPPVPPDRLG
jgi:hypothetical protein